MIAINNQFMRYQIVFFLLLCLLALIPGQTQAAEYANALNGVQRFAAVYQVTQGSPRVANAVFWAVRNSYQDPAVQGLKQPAKVAIVFHGPAVKLLSSDKYMFSEELWPEVEKFQQTLRQMKAEGVNLEVCLYAAKLLRMAKESIIPAVDQVPNGFVSVVGYQMQGYAVVRIP